LLALYCLVGLHTQVHAENVNAQLETGVVVNAEYLEGDTSRPAFLVLHGFLQTSQFLATRKIIEGLSGTGSSVLGPNLSLGATNRKQSLQCEAAHTHTLKHDLKEIDFWIRWLLAKGHRSVIIVGHSWGSQHAIAYQLGYRNKAVSAIIAVSLVRSVQSEQALKLKETRVLVANKDQNLRAYQFSFCKKYMATADSYLSYAEWTDTRALKSVSTLTAGKFPLFAILGSKDKRIDDQWVESLRKSGVTTSIVDGANHFFSSMHEFDLLDELERITGQLIDESNG